MNSAMRRNFGDLDHIMPTTSDQIVRVDANPIFFFEKGQLYKEMQVERYKFS